MSFDLLLVRMPPEASKREIRAAAAAAVKANPSDRPPDSQIEARKRAVADAMLVIFPELEERQLDYAKIARSQGITENEARARTRWISLYGPEDGFRVEIDLYDTWASISMPHGRGENTEAEMDELWSYLEALVTEGGFVVYDAQRRKVVDVAAGPKGDRASPSAAKRPWWRFW
ncbi:MAG TPA: hypothetical protein VES88_03260 [Gemmatimonadaceae bacterium]|nr:hypothetical protein [Gemmatimonadaceae bacterium]